jgi:hypothetical protein
VKNSVLKNVDIYVPKTIRFRKENSFWLMNIRWANSIEITNEEGEFFLKMQKSSGKFNHEDFKDIGSVDRLVGLICKEALKSDKINISIRKTGVNIDPLKLPDLNDESFLENHPNINN